MHLGRLIYGLEVTTIARDGPDMISRAQRRRTEAQVRGPCAACHGRSGRSLRQCSEHQAALPMLPTMDVADATDLAGVAIRDD